MYDAPRKGRVKVFCPKCEEVYIPWSSSTLDLDGAFFGRSFSHFFVQWQAGQIVLPPKVFYYEPKLYGFHLAGKRGSFYYNPALGDAKDTGVA